MQRLSVRLAGFAIATLGFATSSFANAAGDRMAYDAVTSCMVANTLGELDAKDLGQAERAATFRTQGERSFKLAYTLGAKLGLSQAQIKRDLDTASDVELSRMMRDRSYHVTVVGKCKAMGLM